MIGCCGAAEAKTPLISSAELGAEEPRVSFKFGISSRRFESVDLSLSSPALAPRPTLLPSESLVGPAASGQYLDGFVLPDGGTDGNTAFISYGPDNERPAPNSVVFEGVLSSSRSDSLLPNGLSGLEREDKETVFPPEISLDVLVHKQAGRRIYVGGGLSFGSVDSSLQRVGDRQFTRSFTSSTTTTRDTFTAAEGVILPTGPYRGNNQGLGGVLLPLAPSDRETTQTTNTLTQETVIDQSADLDLDLYIFDVHVGLQSQLGNKFYSLLEGGLTFNIIDYGAESRTSFRQRGDVILGQDLSSGVLRDSSDTGTALAFGAYVEAGLGYEISANWSLELAGRYDIVQSITEDLGETQFSFDASGLSASLGLRYSF